MGRPLNRPLPKWCTISVGSSDGMAPGSAATWSVMAKLCPNPGKVNSPQESTKSQEGESREEEEEKRKEGEERKKQEEQKDSMGYLRR